MRIFLILFFLLAPCLVFAQQTADLKVSVDGGEYDDLIFDLADGSKYNFVISVENLGDQTENMRVFMEAVEDENQSFIKNTIFFDQYPSEEVKNILLENDNDIVTYCNKTDLEDVEQNWCEGSNEVVFEIEVGDTYNIPVLIAVDSGEIDHNANIVVEKISNDGSTQVVDRKEILYRLPKKDITSLNISNIVLEKKFGVLDIASWWDNGMKEVYEARYHIDNIGTNDTQYVYDANVHSQWIGEEVHFEQIGYSIAGYESDADLALTMPRLGKMQVIASVKYVDQNGLEQEIKSEPILFVVWPATLLILLVLGGCFCLASVLLYKYVRKNMFGRKKKEKKQKENAFNGTYIVQDADNIISIAQRYDVAWKELAKQNGIEPPYILISGETISVPGDAGDQNKEKQKENKESQWKKKDVSVDAKEQVAEVKEKEQLEPVTMLSQEKQKVQSQAMEVGGSQKMTAAEDQMMPEKDIEKEGSTKKKRRVTFASPKNMLTKPSSEPTTRAIDIEWMRDDEVAYLEEMEVQEKKTGRRFIAVIIFVLLMAGAVLWWGATWFMQRGDNNNVSVDTLINESDVNEKESSEENIAVAQLESEEEVNGEENEVDKSEEESDENLDEELDEKKTQEEVKSSSDEMMVQVLNGGAAAGVAGSISDELGDAGYNMNTAQNSQNDYEDVVIYYGSEYKEQAEDVAEKVGEKYGEKKMEESNDVVKKYGAGIVVVVGS